MQATRFTPEQVIKVLVRLKLTRLLNTAQVGVASTAIALALANGHGAGQVVAVVIGGGLVLEGLYHSWVWPL